MVHKPQRLKKGRPVNGIVILDKPGGMSSNAALQQVKKLFRAQKAGHTGSLDPLATGVLPICLGEATKVSHYLLDADKRYRAKCILGSVTTTGDSEGDIIARHSLPDLNREQLLRVLASFLGEQEQMPPMYSALKYQGRPLYEYARQGIEIKRKTRRITIKELKLLDFHVSNQSNNGLAFVEIEVLCSKGTYIRSLCEDIGQALGSGAHISELRRLQSGPFLLTDSVSLAFLADNFSLDKELDEVQFKRLDQWLKPVDTALQQFTAIHLNTQQYQYIQQGRSILPDQNVGNGHIGENYRLYFNNTLIALAILDKDREIKPKRLLFL